jgi:hypothetical protein
MVEVTIATTHNASGLRDELAAVLEAKDDPVSRAWYEMRSMDAGPLIVHMIGWKVAAS